MNVGAPAGRAACSADTRSEKPRSARCGGKILRRMESLMRLGSTKRAKDSERDGLAAFVELKVACLMLAQRPPRPSVEHRRTY
jgi:hypothetical protein